MPDILSQEEVDLLLNVFGSGETEAETPAAAPSELRLIGYDFRRPERVSKEQIKGLQSLFEAFAREINLFFPPYFRTVVRVELTSIDQLTYDEFILSVARPTALSVINLSPLDGSGVLELSPSIVFPIVDRVLGGKGLSLPEPRELTEIEARVIQRIVGMMLDCLKRAWSQIIEFKLSVEHQESDPLIVQVVAGSEMVILTGYEMHIGEAVGSMNFCIPLLSLGPILEQISQQAHYVRKLSPEVAQQTRQALMNTLRHALVPVDVILGSVPLHLVDIAHLQEGDVVMLNTSPGDPVEVRVNGVPRFTATPGRKREERAVQILSILRDE
jgi:flagellar motor switch protein FliM